MTTIRPSEIRYVRKGTSYERKDKAPDSRYWIGLQKWVAGEGENAIVYDVALVPFKTKPTQVKTTRLQAAVAGRKVRPEVARGIQVERRGITDLIVYGSPGKRTSCGEVTFIGRACVVSSKGGRPVRAAVIDGGEVTFQGRTLIRNVGEGLTEKRL